MASFNIYAQSGGIYAKLIVNEVSHSLDNNTTQLSWAVYMWNTTATWYSYDNKNVFRISIDNNVVWNTASYGRVSLQYYMGEASAKLMGSGNVTVTHNTDGSRTVPLYMYIAQEHQSPPLFKWEGSTTATLTNIARSSQPSCITYPETTNNIGKLGDTIYIHTNRASANFGHIIRYKWGNQEGTIADHVGNNCVWTIPLEFAKEIPNRTNGRGTIYCDTYSGSTFLGTKSVGFVATVPDSMVPSISNISVTPVNSNATVNEWGVFVKGFSKMKINWTASGAYGSKIDHYTISYNGVASDVQNGYTSSILTSSGTSTLYYKAVDTRGRTTQDFSKSITVYDYMMPQITVFQASRQSNNPQTLSLYSIYSISSVGGKNTIKSVVLTYKRSSSSSWLTSAATISNGGTITLSGFSESVSYDLQLSVTDTIGNTSQRVIKVGTSAALLDFRAGGKGFSVGKISEKDAFEVEMKSYLNDSVYMTRGFNIFNTVGTDGTSGWVKVARITIGMSYANYPIEFTIGRRGYPQLSRLTVMFNNQNTTDPTLHSFTYSGGVLTANIKRAGSGIWDIYIKKAEAYDNIVVADVKTNIAYCDEAKLSITYPNTFTTTAPGGTAATELFGYDGVDVTLMGGKLSLGASDFSFFDTAHITQSGKITADGSILAGCSNTYSALLSSASNRAYLALYNNSAASTDNLLILYADRTYLSKTAQLSAGASVYNEFEIFAATPHIDFHFAKSTADYTARIIENAKGALTAYNSISSASDERLKKDIADLPDDYVDFVEQLVPHLYRFKNGSDYLNAGLIAQEVKILEQKFGIEESVLIRGTGEEIKMEDGEAFTDYYSIDYNALLILLLKYTITKIQALENKGGDEE